MQQIIESFDGNTREVARLRQEISQALHKGPVKVKLWQPGIMYEKNQGYGTVVDFINEWQGQPVSFYGNLVPLREVKCEFHYTNDMFISGHNLYQSRDVCKEALGKLEKGVTGKRYHWDFLFGQRKEFKDRLHKFFLQHPVFSKTLSTYFGLEGDPGIWSNGFIPERHTAETIDGNQNPFDNDVRISDLVDPQIYNQSLYSVAMETVIHNDFAMFSEKEAKPIMAERPFVIVGARHHLKAFRELGFKTFSPVIDESYDEIEGLDARFIKILDSMFELTKQDPVEVYKTLKPVLDHNKKHFLENKWTRV